MVRPVVRSRPPHLPRWTFKLHSFQLQDPKEPCISIYCLIASAVAQFGTLAPKSTNHKAWLCAVLYFSRISFLQTSDFGGSPLLISLTKGATTWHRQLLHQDVRDSQGFECCNTQHLNQGYVVQVRQERARQRQYGGISSTLDGRCSLQKPSCSW
jgi:hypothetical protein